MIKPLTVFLCSTFADLSEERERVLDGIRRLQLQHDSMEFFGARADLPIETCLAEVRKSNVLVVIVGHRYGSLVPNRGISFSEAEYREGQRLGKPCLVYLRDENVPILPKHVERDPQKQELLEKWKETLTARHTVAKFTDVQQLAVQVTADLSRTIQALVEERARTDEHYPGEAGIASDFQTLLSDAIAKGLPAPSIMSAVRRAVADLLAKSGFRTPVVFLSYSHNDKDIVRKVGEGLKAAGIDVWIDEERIKFGDSIVTAISRGLDSADFVALFLSNASTSSVWARRELDAAISRQLSGDRGATVLPVLLDEAEIPALLKDVMYLDMRNHNVDEGVNRLVAAIKHHQLERLHTYEAGANRYYNPPANVSSVGRRLVGTGFHEIVSHLHGDEVLLGVYRNQVDALVATHLHSKEHMDKMENLYAPAEGYYALAREVANEGMDDPIPPRAAIKRDSGNKRLAARSTRTPRKRDAG